VVDVTPVTHAAGGAVKLGNSVVDVVAALAVYAVLGLITDALVRLLERRALAWRRGILSPTRSPRPG
jgi:hypothetical protein